mmetsp:Transcript_332/g.367  ORF Transcript_332/g.367 Transcript_332/m.367 type:complete len:136 (-) Transcript_332:473-880(-)
MLLKIGEESKRKRLQSVKSFVVGIIVVICFCIAATVIATPFLAWFNFSLTHLDTNFWTLRYFFMLLYIGMNIAINLLPLVNNFMFFLSDGIVLSQLTSLYMFNEFSITCFISIAPVLFVVQNHFLVRGIHQFSKD